MINILQLVAPTGVGPATFRSQVHRSTTNSLSYTATGLITPKNTYVIRETFNPWISREDYSIPSQIFMPCNSSSVPYAIISFQCQCSMSFILFLIIFTALVIPFSWCTGLRSEFPQAILRLWSFSISKGTVYKFYTNNYTQENNQVLM